MRPSARFGVALLLATACAEDHRGSRWPHDSTAWQPSSQAARNCTSFSCSTSCAVHKHSRATLTRTLFASCRTCRCRMCELCVSAWSEGFSPWAPQPRVPEGSKKPAQHPATFTTNMVRRAAKSTAKAVKHTSKPGGSGTAKGGRSWNAGDWRQEKKRGSLHDAKNKRPPSQSSRVSGRVPAWDGAHGSEGGGASEQDGKSGWLRAAWNQELMRTRRFARQNGSAGGARWAAQAAAFSAALSSPEFNLTQSQTAALTTAFTAAKAASANRTRGGRGRKKRRKKQHFSSMPQSNASVGAANLNASAAKSAAAKAWAQKHRYYQAMGEQVGELLFGVGTVLLCIILLSACCLESDAGRKDDRDDDSSEDQAYNGGRVALPPMGH